MEVMRVRRSGERRDVSGTTASRRPIVIEYGCGDGRGQTATNSAKRPGLTCELLQNVNYQVHIAVSSPTKMVAGCNEPAGLSWSNGNIRCFSWLDSRVDLELLQG